MLYKLNKEKKDIVLMPYFDFAALSKKEKDLENLLAKNLSELYVEDGQLMTIFQERAWQEEPDLCALDKDGNLVIFELKRGEVQGDTTIQVMKYAQYWGQMTYFELQERYRKFCDDNNVDLSEAHREAFGLENSLSIDEFNRSQRLIIVGSFSDNRLIEAVDYWKSKGILIDFIPYRVYEINNEFYFEFFSKPYDVHINPSDKKGIIFDTNKTYDENAIWDMMRDSKVSAYGSVKDAVRSFKKDDYVFYYHKGYGIVAAGTIKSDTKENKENLYDEESYREVKLITPKISKIEDVRYISYAELRELLNKGFYLARTTKVPYLSEEECKQVLELLKKKYDM